MEPGATCVQQADQLSMTIEASLNATPNDAVLLEKTFGGGLKTGLRGFAATNPNQHLPLYQDWAKSQAGPLYWAVLTALLAN